MSRPALLETMRWVPEWIPHRIVDQEDGTYEVTWFSQRGHTPAMLCLYVPPDFSGRKRDMVIHMAIMVVHTDGTCHVDFTARGRAKWCHRIWKGWCRRFVGRPNNPDFRPAWKKFQHGAFLDLEKLQRFTTVSETQRPRAGGTEGAAVVDRG